MFVCARKKKNAKSYSSRRFALIASSALLYISPYNYIKKSEQILCPPYTAHEAVIRVCNVYMRIPLLFVSDLHVSCTI